MRSPPSRNLLTALGARFDGAALRVTLPGQPERAVRAPTAAQVALWAPIHAWCFLGAGNGSSPLLHPTQAPQVDQRFSVAVWRAATDAEQDVVDAFSRHLDGSHQLLAAGGAWAGLLLRVRVKACDVAWWRHRQESDPWDCGYVPDEPAVHRALRHFQPRRATLMVAQDWPAEALAEAVAQMAQCAWRFQHPVRWLVVERRHSNISERLQMAGVPVQALQPRAAEA